MPKQWAIKLHKGGVKRISIGCVGLVVWDVHNITVTAINGPMAQLYSLVWANLYHL
jgi:hypothetical protein